ATTDMKAISSTTNDGGASILGGLVDAFTSEYNYSSKSGAQVIKTNDIVRVASDHTAGAVTKGIYKYIGTEQSIDLTTEDFSNQSSWERITRTNASDTIPNIGNVTDSDSQAFGGLVVRNDVRSEAISYINNADISTTGNIVISADESATITARDSSTVTSSGGSAYGTGESMAINGLIATNLVLSDSKAYITNSDITTTQDGDLILDAKNTSAIDAKIVSTTQSGDKAIGVTLAFNTIGWEAQNILFRTIDALLGTSIGDEDTAQTKAYIEDTTLTISGDVSITADNSALLNATISNAADSQASALYGAGGTAASAMLASNMVSSEAKAYIDFDSTGTVTASGVITIISEDAATIYSNTKIVSSSVTTNDGAASITNETIGDLTSADFLSEDGSQKLLFGEKVRLSDDYASGGKAGAVYKFLGNIETIDLSNTDYSNQDYWQQLKGTNIIPEGYNVSDSDSTAVGGIVVRNDVRSTVESFVDHATVSAASMTIAANETATIQATADSVVKSSGGSAYGSGTSLAVNGIIATNLILSKSNAYITNSDITTTADLTLDAQNTSTINAMNKSVTTTGDTGVGVTLAFNTIGWEAQNILFQAIDAIIGTDIADEQPAEVKAYIEDTSLNITGILSLNAESKATLNASVSNDATSAASALINASGMAVSGIVSSNMVSSLADAYINYIGDQGTVHAGSITINAKDDAAISATTNMKAISSTTNDGGASLLGDLVDAFTSEFNYSSKSGTQTVKVDDIVRVASDHTAGGVTKGIYTYKGTEDAIDLGTEDFSDRDTWERITRTNASDTIPNIGNVTDSDSQSFGGIVVRNDIRSNVLSYINNAKVSAGKNISISADESATITARDNSTASSSGGSAYGSGESMAVNGLIATNLVLSNSNAYITKSDVTTTEAGNLIVDSKNTSAIDAKIVSSTSSGDKAIGVTLAFNTIGWEAQNILFRALDALLGSEIGDEQPAETKAYIEDTTLNIDGNVTITADNYAFLNATISNAADSTASALYGAGGTAASAMLASNMVSTDTKAYIDYKESGTVTVTGAININAKDQAGIYSNTKIVSSSITTNDGGASIANETIGDLMEANFLSEDGSQKLEYGDKVRLSDDYANGGDAGSVYKFLGKEKTVDLTNTDYTDLDYWQIVTGTNLIPEGYNISDSDSTAVGGIV
ncbi:MAG: hypothetical protein OMM_10525, partial [Candidatus Magnetoglobus multicellularis str. Araruama]